MIKKKYAIIGLGASGVSTAKFLKLNNHDVFLLDSNSELSNIDDILSLNLKSNLFLGLNKFEMIKKLKQLEPDEIVLSPGCVTTFFDDLKELNYCITCDVELFVNYVKKKFNSKIIGITGTNGKSTTTALTHHLLQSSNYPTFLGGNYGIPVFELIDEDITKDTIFVLELSSFHLEMSKNLDLDSAVILNLAPDHLDRYKLLKDYYNAKFTIYDNAKNLVSNLDDESLKSLKNSITFSLHNSQADFYIKDNNIYLDSHKIFNTELISIFGDHNRSNILASMALIYSLLPNKDLEELKELKSIAKNIHSFKGLEHRSETFYESDSLIWVNDSKGTNLGATVAALKGLKNVDYDKLWLILGGILKESDFNEINQFLNELIESNKVGKIFVFGESQKEIYKNILSGSQKEIINLEKSKDNPIEIIVDSIIRQNKKAHSKSIVLFSPACSSFDMFKNFKHRGRSFKEIVKSRYARTE